MRALLILGTVMLFSCSHDDFNFELSGTVNGGKGKTIYLSCNQKIDSVIIDSDDRFSFRGQTNSGNFYNLYFDKISPILLFVDSGNVIGIESGFENFSNSYKVAGSAVSEEIRMLQFKLMETFAKVQQVQATNMQNADSSNIDSIRNVIAQEINKIVDEHRNFVFSFIKQRPSSFAVLPAIFQSFDARNPIFNFVNDFKYYTMIDSALMKSHPNSVHAQDFHSQYIQMKRQYEPYLQKNNNPVENQSAPDFIVTTPAGGNISLSSLRGKWVLLDFWAAWCGPCRHENPNLVNAFTLFSKKNFTIFQVSLDQNKNEWVSAIEKDGVGKWNHGSDLKYWDSEPAKIYGINSIPSNFLINPEGIIVAQNLRGPALIEKLKEVLK